MEIPPIRPIHLLLLLALCAGGWLVAVTENASTSLEVPAEAAATAPGISVAPGLAPSDKNPLATARALLDAPGLLAVDLFERAGGRGRRHDSAWAVLTCSFA